MRRRKTVYCAGCAHLFLLPGFPPQCVATAEFVGGPLRKRIDVVGRVPAERRNLHNDCEYREIASLRAWRLKRWVLWRLSDGREESIDEQSLKSYPVSEEGKRAEVYRSKYGHTLSDEEIADLIHSVGSGAESEEVGEDEDILQCDSGDRDSDESGSADPIWREDILDGRDGRG